MAVVKTIALNFITERCTNEVLAVGINTVREILSRVPALLREDGMDDFVQDLVKAVKTKGLGEVSAWLVCDHHHLREYGLGAVAKAPLPIGRYLKSGYLKKGATIEELARAISVPADALVQEVQAFSRDAATGSDAKFGKGSTAYNRYQGDALIKPNPCMAAIEQGPFYAIRLVVGEIGTFAGLATDATCRVLTRDGRAVEGLYVVGNDAASVMGGNYPGAGITLGPCVTFGFVAGMALAQRAEIIRGEPQRLAA
jgi:succinate dehydrogenase/fumarate reductase flavoprotein subunit